MNRNRHCLCDVITQNTDHIQWRHNEPNGVSNHRRLDCLLKRLFRHRSKKSSKLRATGLCEGNSPWPVNSPHKGPVTRKMVPFDDVIMDDTVKITCLVCRLFTVTLAADAVNDLFCKPPSNQHQKDCHTSLLAVTSLSLNTLNTYTAGYTTQHHIFNIYIYATLFSGIPTFIGFLPQKLWWRHQMETFSSPFVRGIHRSPQNSPHKGQWASMFSLIRAWTNGWVNNRDAGDLRRHRTHYDVIVLPNAAWSYIIFFLDMLTWLIWYPYQHHCSFNNNFWLFVLGMGGYSGQYHN